MNIARLLLPCRLAVAHVLVKKQIHSQYILNRGFYVTTVRAMAQARITSFFKVSPPKPALSENEKEIHDSAPDLKETPPALNGVEKKSTKRQRLDSSGSENETPQSPKVSSDKKKKPKRQRIESSGSESEINVSEKSPKKLEIKKEKDSPIKNTSPIKTESIKVEKSDKPKTYESPKSKKTKSNKLGVKVISPSNKKTPNKKTEKASTKESPVKEESLNESEVKKEVSGSRESSPETNKENIVKKENTDNTDEATLVPDIEYDPSKADYHPTRDACWRAGQPVPYVALARTLAAIERTPARLRTITTLANHLRSVMALTPEDLLPSLYLCLNQLAPAYHSLELGIAETYLMKAVGQCTGRTLAQVRSAARAAGDLGAAAAAARQQQRTMFAAPPLTTRKVFAALKDIAHMTGAQSVNKKIAKIQSLFVACRDAEAKFLIRSLEGKLRIGLAEQSVLQALAQAAASTPPGPAGVTVLDASKGLSADTFKSRVDEIALIVKTTYCECPNLELVVGALLAHGAEQLPEHCRLTVGIPLKPMLAHPTRAVTDVFTRFEGCQFTCEWKYDGERAQIHVPSGEHTADLAAASIFSRNQENNTSKYPDVLSRLSSLLRPRVRSCVLDCEVVAYDREHGQILPFQVLSTRKRKGASISDIGVQVCVFIFDVLLLNDEPLVRKPLRERRELLREHFNTVPGEWQFAESRDACNIEEVQQFMEEAVKGSCEGLMVKTLEGDAAYYDIARRSHNWLKLKKDYLEGAGDSLDVVVIGAYLGKGRRRDVFGGFLAAAREPASDTYQALCKLGTGFSDEALAALTLELRAHVIPQPRSYYNVESPEAADVWFDAACVWEVRCADLSLSPAHRAAIGLVDPDKGISLRFPRFIRTRPDKTPEQATTAQQIAEMYLAQDQVKNRINKPAVNLDDFY